MLTFDTFSKANRQRIPDFDPTGDGHTVEELALCISEECGESAAAVLGWNGAKKRKAHLNAKDIADECADAITYLDLLIQRLGFRTDEALIHKFNRVSERASSSVRIYSDGSGWGHYVAAERKPTKTPAEWDSDPPLWQSRIELPRHDMTESEWLDWLNHTANATD